MEDFEKAILYGGEISFNTKGKTFTVKPLPSQYIFTEEFKKSALYLPKDKGNVGQYQVLNLTDEARRAELDKWIQRLLFHDGNPVTLEQLCVWDWDIGDIGRWLDLVMEISGLAISESKPKENEEASFMPLIVFIQSKGNMRRDEILAAPLFLLNSIQHELVEIWQQEMTMRLNSGLAGLMGGGTETEQQPKADPRMGTMQQPKSRDEFFAMTNMGR